MASPIDRFDFQGVLGKGGMAVVHLAHDTVLDRPVALKVLHLASLGDSAAAKRFEQEARLIARVPHNHIVTIHDYINHGDTAYIVMDYMAGGSLDDYVGLLTLPQIGGVLDAVLSALDRVSRLDPPVVHRDLKPHNLLVSADGEEVKVADFGIARITGHTMTSSGNAIGTVAYMAPEQWQRSGALDQRTDLYSVGVIAYELLTGMVPFRAEEPMGVAWQHMHDAPVDPRTLVPAVDAELAAWTLRLLAKAPGDRFQTPAEARAELQTILGHAAGDAWRENTRLTVPQAREVSTVDDGGTLEPSESLPAPAWWRRLPGAAAGVLAVAGLVVVVVWSPWSAAEGGGAVIGPTPTASPAPGVVLTVGDHVRAQMPVGWKEVPVPRVTGLSLASSARAAAPAADAEQALAIIGIATRSAHRPELVGPALAKRLSREPEDAELAAGVEASRYKGNETVYVAPTTAGVVTVVCLRLADATCRDVARSVELVDANGFPVAPDRDFAAAVNRALKGIYTKRQALDKADSVGKQAEAAEGVAKRFDRARKQLARLDHVSPADEPAQAAIATAAGAAKSAYDALASAAAEGDAVSYTSAGKAANTAEKDLASALSAMRRRGYKNLTAVSSDPHAALHIPETPAPPTTPAEEGPTAGAGGGGGNGTEGGTSNDN